MLSVREFSYKINSPILEKISLDVKPGQIVCLLGKSGVGKSTLLNAIADQRNGIERTKSIALVTQENLLLDWRTVLENVLLPIELESKVTTNVIIKARQLLEIVFLSDSLSKFPNQLSGGMKQRVSLARAMLQDAELYLFDEPFSAIDFELRVNLGRSLRDFIVSKNKGALFITHNIEEAISLGDKILVLSGSPGEIKFDSDIKLAPNEREILNLKNTLEYKEKFASIWSALKL